MGVAAIEVVANQFNSGPSIALPSKEVLLGKGSPTSVFDVNISKSKELEFLQHEAPQWFARGSDVDELLNEAEALDWLSDPGNLVESYNVTVQHPETHNVPIPLPAADIVATIEVIANQFNSGPSITLPSREVLLGEGSPTSVFD